MCAMLEISNNAHLKELGWRLLLQEQVDDEVILEGPTEFGEEARAIVVECMSKLFDGKKIPKGLTMSGWFEHLFLNSRNYDCIEKSCKGKSEYSRFEHLIRSSKISAAAAWAVRASQ
ncbi:hypothetical protein RHGRI_009510 [Rhododendron griersonianum]|uniref:Uncharacterized protein n=1 Tax=Rhododendron griersonianum TaxID=479676 RepID=A0AAV6KG45_9ERIC|nr:hypothetical protein RHGRI_009510 [Rhododendron griersonianum]